MKGTNPNYISNATRTSRCRNCDEQWGKPRLFLGLCPVCRRPLNFGILIGGIVFGIAFKLFDWLMA